MIAELQEVADYFSSLDEELTTISGKWLERNGISKQAIEAEFEKYKRGEVA